jgi:hypothetical protein
VRVSCQLFCQLQDVRNESTNLPTVFQILFSVLVYDELFFGLGFDPEGKADDEDSQEAADESVYERSAQQSRQKPCVDRCLTISYGPPWISSWSCSAPVGAKDGSRPNAEEQAGNSKDSAAELVGDLVRDHPSRKPSSDKTVVKVEDHHGSQENHPEVEEARTTRLSLYAALCDDTGKDPKNENRHHA